MTYSHLAAEFIGGNPAHMQGAQTPGYVVIHGTVSPCVRNGARNTANYFTSSSAGGLAHYVVDPGEIIACCQEEVAAWHSGHNADSLGVELCDPQVGDSSRWADADHDAMLLLAAKLVADLCTRWNIPIQRLSPAELRDGGRGIVGHNDVRLAWPGCTDHTDPGAGFPWEHFLNLVRQAAAPAAAPSTPSEVPVIYTFSPGGSFLVVATKVTKVDPAQWAASGAPVVKVPAGVRPDQILPL